MIIITFVQAGALKAQWNQHLLEEALPTCIAETLALLPAHLEAVKVSGGGGQSSPGVVLYSALPDLELVRAPFEGLAVNAIRKAAALDGCKLLYDAASATDPWVGVSVRTPIP